MKLRIRHEGAAASSYWQAISESLPKNFQFATRSRPAADAFNAMLNYAYGMLYNRVEQALLLAGIQPQIAFFHRDGYNLSSMTWDFIEPYRIWVEIPVFRLFSGKFVHSNHTLQMPKEVILTDEGKKLVAGQVITALDIDVIKHKGRNQVRDRILRDEAHEFANALLNA
jgi:CRISP-associated protein Cas1